ncbi:hypothetical protein [Rickettsia endosymbiont of Gonocerus acuteangulatus]|uniref:hypothetical protein n=1 Tax=Rickettsia endosymbiont of Gonocerus acuteangulatus TaxID=3066266 RepID=UPI003133291F
MAKEIIIGGQEPEKQNKEEIKFNDIGIKLTEVNNNFDKILESLKKAISKDPTNKALLNAMKDFNVISEEFKNHTENVKNNIDEIISSPIKNLAEHLEKNTPLGKLQKFVTDQAEKAQEKLHSSLDENKVLKAAWGVVLAVCEVIKVTVSAAVNSTIANGKLATSVKDFGAAVSDSLQKKPATGRVR